MGALPGSLVVGGAKGSMVGGCAPGASQRRHVVWLRLIRRFGGGWRVHQVSSWSWQRRWKFSATGRFACRRSRLHFGLFVWRRNFDRRRRHFIAIFCAGGFNHVGVNGVRPAVPLLWRVSPGCYRCTVAVGARNRVGAPTIGKHNARCECKNTSRQQNKNLSPICLILRHSPIPPAVCNR